MYLVLSMCFEKVIRSKSRINFLECRISERVFAGGHSQVTPYCPFEI